MKRQLTLLAAGLLLMAFHADKPAYRIFSSEGKEVPFAKMMKSLYEAEVILFGESHDNPIAHWLQLELTADLYRHDSSALILGAEMFEADNQLLLDEYLGGTIPEAKFEEEARLWKNYETDYKPLLKFAFEHKLPFVATNVPRRYANLVYREGFEGLETLASEAKRFVAPLPVQYDPGLSGYRAMLGMNHGPGSEPNENLPKAQAIKDATMGYFILKNWSPGKRFLHFNGSGHSDDREGIVWYLLQDQPGLRIATLTTVTQENIGTLQEGSAGKADFIIAVPANMTRTY